MFLIGTPSRSYTEVVVLYYQLSNSMDYDEVLRPRLVYIQPQSMHPC